MRGDYLPSALLVYIQPRIPVTSAEVPVTQSTCYTGAAGHHGRVAVKSHVQIVNLTGLNGEIGRSEVCHCLGFIDEFALGSSQNIILCQDAANQRLVAPHYSLR